MKFEILSFDAHSSARAGRLTTAHGEIETPIFMPVGTAGTVKAVHQRELENDIQAQIILGNTYHLYLRPGLEVLQQAGGLHKFIHWPHPLLTDSGGYQVYSLGGNRKIKEEGVTFQSHIDGSRHLFTPEKVIDIERKIGADFIMSFDECTPYPCDYSYARESMHRTHRWLERCADRFKSTQPLYGYEQTLIPILQGSTYDELRKQSAEFVSALDFPAYAIGGLSVGEPAEVMYDVVSKVCSALPAEKPRYLMGVGTPENILEGISRGIDMFDCVLPTRNARNGMLFTTQGIINIRNEKWKNCFEPIDKELDGYVRERCTKAYLRHLIISHEILGAQIASLHNLTFYLWLAKESRRKIAEGNFTSWKNQMLELVSKRL